MILSKEIENKVFSLPLQERARLADMLISSLEPSPDETWFAGLDLEIQSRMDAVQRGDIASTDGEKVLERMWNLLGT